MPGSNKKQYGKLPSAYIAFGIALISLMTLLGGSAFLRVTEIRVEGVSLYSITEIVESSGLTPGDNLLFVNAQNVSSNIRQALPFVYAVEISRVLPDTVLVEITESDAVASIAFAGELLIIDSAGRVLARSAPGLLLMPGIDVANLIEIRGVDIDEATPGIVLKPELGTETKLLYMQDVLAAMEREGMIRDVTYLDVSNITNIHFGYLSMYRVIIGGITNLRHNFGRLPVTVEIIQHRHPNTTGSINMSNAYADPTFIAD